MVDLSKCQMFFQNMGSNECGTFGRSSLEACALGLPTFSYVADTALKAGKVGGFDNLAILNVKPSTFERVFSDMISLDYKTLSNASRKWVVEHYSYPVIGEMYTKFFKELLNEC